MYIRRGYAKAFTSPTQCEAPKRTHSQTHPVLFFSDCSNYFTFQLLRCKFYVIGNGKFQPDRDYTFDLLWLSGKLNCLLYLLSALPHRVLLVSTYIRQPKWKLDWKLSARSHICTHIAPWIWNYICIDWMSISVSRALGRCIRSIVWALAHRENTFAHTHSHTQSHSCNGQIHRTNHEFYVCIRCYSSITSMTDNHFLNEMPSNAGPLKCDIIKKKIRRNERKKKTRKN